MKKNESFFIFYFIVLLWVIAVMVNSEGLKRRVCEILSVVFPQNSVQQTAFTVHLKSGLIVKVNSHIQPFSGPNLNCW